MSDYGTQDHVFSSFQLYANQKIDKFYNVTDEELRGPKVPKAPSQPIFQMRRIDLKKNEEGK